MKAYTDIEQSKKLAKILPLDSADMSYTLDFNSVRYYITTASYESWVVPKYAESYKGLNQVLPCWSLAALLDILHDYTLQTNSDGSVFVVCDSRKPMVSDSYKNPIDACYTMIVELKERNLI